MNMKVYENEKIEYSTVAALGFFDGVHRGHCALIEKAKQLSEKNSARSLVFTFDAHPARVFNKSVKYITTKDEKTFILEKTGIDCLYFQTADINFLSMSAEDFFKTVLIDKLNVSHVVAGENYTFGKNKSGTSRELLELCHKHGIGCHIVPSVCTPGGKIISSSFIRQMIFSGDMETAADMLGRRFFIKNTVVHGRADGRKIGFPTINTLCEPDKILPPFGVYATSTVIGGKKYKSVTNIGCAPTFGENPVTVETNILGFDKDAYGENPTVEFLTKIRSENKFLSAKELIHQIELDINFRNKLEF